MRTFLLALAAAALALPAAAQVYKWLDEDGRVHYSAQRPPAGAEQLETIEPRDTEASPQARKRLAEQQKRLEALRRQREQREQRAAEQAAAEASRRENCAKARENLQNLQTAIRIYETDDQGNRVRVGEEQRQANIEQARAAIEEFCR